MMIRQRVWSALRLDRHAIEAHPLGEQVIAHGGYEDAPLRVYPTRPGMTHSTQTPPDEASPGVPLGSPLIPGLQRTLAPALHTGATALSADRRALVLAFMWHDRIHIYDVATQDRPRHCRTAGDETEFSGDK